MKKEKIRTHHVYLHIASVIGHIYRALIIIESVDSVAIMRRLNALRYVAKCMLCTEFVTCNTQVDDNDG